MSDTAGFKQILKDASDDEARALFQWATACMEVRGLIDIAGAAPARKRRSDAGTTGVRKQTVSALPKQTSGVLQELLDSNINAAQPGWQEENKAPTASLSGLPDEDQR